MPRAAETCCVRNCGKTRTDKVSLHVFPHPTTQPDRFRAWVMAIGGDLWVMDDVMIHKSRRVCTQHFKKEFHTSSLRLSANAVPTLFLTGSLSQPRHANQPSSSKKMRLETLTRQPVASTHTSSQVDATGHVIRPTPSKETMPRQPVASTSSQVDATGHVIPPSPSKETLPRQPVASTSSQVDATGHVIRPSPSKGTGTKKMKSNLKHLSTIFSTDASALARTVKKLQSAKNNYAAKLKKALILSQNSTFQKAIQNFTSAALIFTLLQFREVNKDKMGRRYTKKEKALSLAIYKQGPRAYRWLRYMFVLPSPVTLSRMISRASLRPGINQNIFDHLKKKAKQMSVTDRLCILMFDEIAICPHFQYNRKRDSIIGFVTNGKKNARKIADHALTFMIRGLQKNYKQPISYTFCSGSTPKDELATQIKEVINNMLKLAGFIVVATVCDQGSSNMSAINKLICDTKKKYWQQNTEWRSNTFELDDMEIVPLYDPPHLLKGIRNNLLNKDLICTINNSQKKGRWEHFIKLYQENPSYRGIRLMPNLTEYHINPSKIPKMKVKYATQLLSKSVAIYMGYLADKGILDADVKDTADIILFFDELFDSVNGSFINAKRRPGKPMLGPLTPSSPHTKTWQKAKPILHTMKFMSDKGKCGRVPSITNWKFTIENIEILKTKIFGKYDIRSLWLRHLNQDPLEKFFGGIRSHGGRNCNPTCAAFEVSFASLLINNLSGTHSPGANCEKDSCGTFQSLHKIFFSKKGVSENVCNELNIDLFSDIIIDFEIKKQNPKIKAQLEYVSGFILKKLSKIYKNCKVCYNILNDKNKTSEIIQLKDQSEKNVFLCYPTDNFINQFSIIQDVAAHVLNNESNVSNIKTYIKTVLCVYCNFNFIKCSIHKNDLEKEILDASSRFFLKSWCTEINKILKGAQIEFSASDEIQKLAYQYYSKRRHFKK